MTDAEHFRGRAAYFQELAATETDPETLAALLALAKEYLQRALEIEEAEC